MVAPSEHEVQKKPRTQWSVLVVAIVAVELFVVGLLSLWLEHETNFRVRFLQIREGMTKADAIRIMSCPPGEYHHPSNPSWYRGFAYTMPPNGELLKWTDDRHVYWVTVDGNKTITSARIIECEQREDSLWTRMRLWASRYF